MWNIFGSSAASSSSSSASKEEEIVPSSSNISTGTSTPASLNSESSPSASVSVPTVNRFESVLQDEEKYQALQYPSTEEVPGCMRLLDEFLMCYALAPQLRSMYRYGEFRDCTWKWQDFKYCLSLKSESEEERRALWVKRRADWWAKRRVEGSSEDVWDVRREPLENFPPLGADEVTSETSTT